MPSLVNILDFIPRREHGPIRRGQSTFDCHPAIDRAIKSESYATAHPLYRAGPAIYFPPGVYCVSRAIEIRKRVSLRGDGSGLPYGDATILKFAAESPGLLIAAFDAEGNPGTTGTASVIEGLCLIGSGRTNHAAHGITLRARALCERVYIAGFAGDGLRIEASTGGEGDVRGNANNWRINGARINGCGGNGLYVDGTDVNAGVAIGVDSSANRGWGIVDSSFLGNTYIACHAAQNGCGAYKSDNANARNAFVACYSEGDQPASRIRTPALVVGGLHGAGMAAPGEGPAAPFVESSIDGALTAHGGVQSIATGASGAATVRLGGSAGNGDIVSAHYTEHANLPWRLRFLGADIAFDYANLDAARPLVVTGPHTHYAFGRAAPVAYAAVLQNAFIGQGEAARQHGAGSGPPSGGDRGRGDIVWNYAPSSGGFAGWICIEAGTPGAWRPFGRIE